jgi:two-component system, OmpR family, response regulator MprA
MMISTVGTDSHAIGTVSHQVEHSPRRSVLIVERDPTLLHAMSERFASEGYDVRIAANGLIALNELRRSIPDAVVADVQTPRLTGIELAEELSDWGLPVVLTTASEDIPVPAGVNVLHKPFKVDELMRLSEQATEATGPALRVVSS